MSDEEIRDGDLTPLEKDLASLTPRADRLDPGWGDYLAREAELLGSPRPDDGRLKTCPTAGACPYCGRKATRRWAWPAAFSAMTAVAATLFVALLVGQVADVPPVGQASPLAHDNSAAQTPQPSPENTGQPTTLVQHRPDPSANPQPAPLAAPDSAPGPIAAIPRHGWRLSGPALLESQWPRPAPNAKSSLAEVAGVPPSYRQLLGQYLGQPEGY